MLLIFSFILQFITSLGCSFMGEESIHTLGTLKLLTGKNIRILWAVIKSSLSCMTNNSPAEQHVFGSNQILYFFSSPQFLLCKQLKQIEAKINRVFTLTGQESSRQTYLPVDGEQFSTLAGRVHHRVKCLEIKT